MLTSKQILNLNTNKSMRVLLLLCLISFQKSYAQDTISWKQNIKLEWKDFKGIKDSISWMRAQSSLEVYYEIVPSKGKLSWKINTNFYRNHSWTMSNSANLLCHEQLHFDIAELYSRKIAKKFSDFKIGKSEFRSQLDNIFNELMNEYEVVTNMYDKETNFSQNNKMQKYWVAKINIELKKLEKFKQKRGLM